MDFSLTKDLCEQVGMSQPNFFSIAGHPLYQAASLPSLFSANLGSNPRSFSYTKTATPPTSPSGLFDKTPENLHQKASQQDFYRNGEYLSNLTPQGLFDDREDNFTTDSSLRRLNDTGDGYNICTNASSRYSQNNQKAFSEMDYDMSNDRVSSNKAASEVGFGRSPRKEKSRLMTESRSNNDRAARALSEIGYPNTRAYQARLSRVNLKRFDEEMSEREGYSTDSNSRYLEHGSRMDKFLRNKADQRESSPERIAACNNYRQAKMRASSERSFAHRHRTTERETNVSALYRSSWRKSKEERESTPCRTIGITPSIMSVSPKSKSDVFNSRSNVFKLPKDVQKRIDFNFNSSKMEDSDLTRGRSEYENRFNVRPRSNSVSRSESAFRGISAAISNISSMLLDNAKDDTDTKTREANPEQDVECDSTTPWLSALSLEHKGRNTQRENMNFDEFEFSKSERVQENCHNDEVKERLHKNSIDRDTSNSLKKWKSGSNLDKTVRKIDTNLFQGFDYSDESDQESSDGYIQNNYPISKQSERLRKKKMLKKKVKFSSWTFCLSVIAASLSVAVNLYLISSHFSN